MIMVGMGSPHLIIMIIIIIITHPPSYNEDGYGGSGYDGKGYKDSPHLVKTMMIMVARGMMTLKDVDDGYVKH